MAFFDPGKGKIMSNKSPSELDVVIGRNVKSIRLLKNVSQAGLGGALGITFQQIQKYESAKNRVSASKLHEIAQYLDTPIMKFYGLEDEVLEAMRTADKDLLTLIRLFETIPDQKTKNLVIKIVRQISDSHNFGPAGDE